MRGHYPQVLQLLLNKGADINGKNKSGDTPLILASENGIDVSVRFLLDKGAKVNVRNKWGQTALTKARIAMRHPEWKASNRHPNYNETIRVLQLAGATEGSWSDKTKLQANQHRVGVPKTPL